MFLSKRIAAVALCGLLLGTAACSQSGGATTVSAVAKDYAFELPSEMAAGLVTLRLSNEGKEPHHLQLVRLNDGVSPQQVGQALQKEDLKTLAALVSFEGGPSVIEPGGHSSVTLNLAEGTYMALCFIPGPDGLPHLAKGMVSTFQVRGSKSATLPSSQAQIGMSDFSYQLPSNVLVGQSVMVENKGQQPHEMVIVKLNAGKTAQDFATWATKPDGPAPGHFVGGLQAVGTNGKGWVNLPEEPGSYLFICQVPDPASGKSHAELGMVSQVELK